MTLLITLIAAIIVTILWYQHAPEDTMKLSTLCYLYWGASLMWMVDAVFEYMELQAAFFTPAIEDMINDAFLGFCVIVLGLMIWMVVLFVQDPQKKFHSMLVKR